MTNKNQILSKKNKANKNQNTDKSMSKANPKDQRFSVSTILHNKKSTGSKKEKISYNSRMYLTSDQRKNEWLKQFIAKFNKYISAFLNIKHESRLFVAVSGGVDSMVLMDLLYQATENSNLKLYVCHYNHKLRPDASDLDEDFVRNTSKKYGLNFYTDSGDVKGYAKENSQSIELAARNLRYSFFERIAKSLNVNYIALAHTADDSAETIMFNFLRGTGLTGLSGIPETRNLSKKIQVIRPLIKFRKAELIEYANLRNLKWREDETNSLLIYSRNKIRHELFKSIEKDFNPNIIETLNRTAQIIRSADNFIQEHIKSYLKSAKWNKDNHTLHLQIQLLKSTDRFLQGEIIKNQLESKFKLSGLSQSTIDRVLNLIDLEVGSIAQINNNVIALRERSQIIITKSFKQKKIFLNIQRTGVFRFDNMTLALDEVKPKQAKYESNPAIEILDYEKVPALLTVRNWESGDSFKPLGMTGRVKISDYLINNKVSLIDKSNILVLTSKSDIIWLCGYRINDDYKVTESTTRFLKISLNSGSANE